jgi:hypothetical protein
VVVTTLGHFEGPGVTTVVMSPTSSVYSSPSHGTVKFSTFESLPFES